jgi:hypothetical protein
MPVITGGSDLELELELELDDLDSDSDSVAGSSSGNGIGPGKGSAPPPQNKIQSQAHPPGKIRNGTTIPLSPFVLEVNVVRKLV